MNTYYSFDEPLVLKPTWADRLADWYWPRRRDIIAMAASGVFGTVMSLAAVLVLNS